MMAYPGSAMPTGAAPYGTTFGAGVAQPYAGAYGTGVTQPYGKGMYGKGKGQGKGMYGKGAPMQYGDPYGKGMYGKGKGKGQGKGKTPYWAPTAGGGKAKQYPPGTAGIPYAVYPGYGLVQ